MYVPDLRTTPWRVKLQQPQGVGWIVDRGLKRINLQSNDTVNGTASLIIRLGYKDRKKGKKGLEYSIRGT